MGRGRWCRHTERQWGSAGVGMGAALGPSVGGGLQLRSPASWHTRALWGPAKLVPTGQGQEEAGHAQVGQVPSGRAGTARDLPGLLTPGQLQGQGTPGTEEFPRVIPAEWSNSGRRGGLGLPVPVPVLRGLGRGRLSPKLPK